MADEPKFYSRNWIDRAGDNVASTGQSTIQRIFDRDKVLKWQSLGSDDLTTETLRSKFQVGGNAIQRSFDTVVVLGHNIDTMKVQKWNGSVWSDIAGASVSAETEDYTIFTFTEVTDYGVGISMDTTQTVDAEKQVGELLALETLWAPSSEGLSDIGITKIPVGMNANLFDGGMKINALRWTGQRTKREVRRVGFNFISKADHDTFESVMQDNLVFTAYLEPVQRPDEFILMTGRVDPFSSGYMVQGVKTPGYAIAAELYEV